MALRGVYKITGIVDNPVLFLFTPTGLKSLSREKYLLSVSGIAGSDLGAAFIGMSRSGSLDSLATLHRRGTVRQALLLPGGVSPSILSYVMTKCLIAEVAASTTPLAQTDKYFVTFDTYDPT